MDDIIIAKKYKLARKIGYGSFGEIYRATNLETGQEVALKLEKKQIRHPHLKSESRILRSLQGGTGFPTMYWYGEEGDFNIMVLDLLGASLEDIFQRSPRRFSLKTVLMIADQAITQIEHIHNNNFIHRDIKPENYLIGIGDRAHLIYVIDFGLSKRYFDSGSHIPYRDGKNLAGTARYASLNTHMGIEQSRRDDLECLFYVLLYFLKGSLPWQGLRAHSKKERYSRIMEAKVSTSVESLCRGLPYEFVVYLNYVRGLEFLDKPDYCYLRGLLKEVFDREGYVFDYVYDWSRV